MKQKLLMFFIAMSSVQSATAWYHQSVVNGKVVESGERSCISSYNVLTKVFSLYKRPFTVLDLGAAQGFFSFMAAANYDATCVMVEGDYDYSNHTNKLLDLCRKNTELDKIVFLKKRVDLSFLKNLSDCEHFDVTLALNFVHHSGLDWKKAIDYLVEMGDNLILENPPSTELAMTNEENEKRHEIDLYMKSLGAVLLGEVDRHNKSLSKSKIWWLHKKKKTLAKRHVFWPPPASVPYKDDGKVHLISSDFDKKELIKVCGNKRIVSSWNPGINLVSFLAFGGSYPDKNILLKELSAIKSEDVFDWGPANMIVGGRKLRMIDREDFSTGNPTPNKTKQLKSNLLKEGIISEVDLNYDTYWKINQTGN